MLSWHPRADRDLGVIGTQLRRLWQLAVLVGQHDMLVDTVLV